MMLSIYLSLLDTQEEQDKLTYIYHKYYGLMCHVAFKNLRNSSDVEDVVHESIMKMMKYLDKINLEDEPAARGYICSIVATKARDENRRFTPAVEYESLANYVATSGDVVNIVQSEEGYRTVVRCIKELPPTLRDTVTLRYLDGLKYQEIADLLGTTTDNVGVRINRARAILRKRLAEIWGDV